jgi:hypothetical protein
MFFLGSYLKLLKDAPVPIFALEESPPPADWVAY